MMPPVLRQLCARCKCLMTAYTAGVYLCGKCWLDQKRDLGADDINGPVRERLRYQASVLEAS